VKDPLELFKNIPDFPGKRTPKNRQKRNTAIAEDRFNGAKSKKYIINGQEVHMFTIGQLAVALQKSPSTLRVWEFRGWLPKAKYRTPKPVKQQLPEKPSKGRRLYSMEQVEFLVEAIDRFKIHDIHNADWNGFRKHIKEQWPQ
jgi:hypothetical protein